MAELPQRKRVLVLGATGMLGHKLALRLSQEFAVAGTIRQAALAAPHRAMMSAIRIYPNVDARHIDALDAAIADWGADVVVNCIGLVKQAETAHEPVAAITLNALLPHQLHALAGAHGARFIHFSTDCVFSGRGSGPYTERDRPDPDDLYGRSKLLGEVTGANALTLRGSFIGRELMHRLGLVEWLISQRGGHVHGYARALYSGLTTLAAADLVADIVRSHPDLVGIWHASAEPIGKYDLLARLNRAFALGVAIARDDSVVIDRRLDSTQLRRRTGWRPPSWDDMMTAMSAEDAVYESAVE